WKVSPKDPHIADTLGWAYYQKQMYGKAAGLLKEAIDKLPEDPLVLYHYGMAQYWNDNKAEAKKFLTKFLTLSPNNPDASEARKVLAALSPRPLPSDSSVGTPASSPIHITNSFTVRSPRLPFVGLSPLQRWVVLSPT